jgi:hypothetical protein
MADDTSYGTSPNPGANNTSSQPNKVAPTGPPKLPNGIADPNNPGYDTNGYQMGATYDPTTGKLTVPNSGTGKTTTTQIDPKTGLVTLPSTGSTVPTPPTIAPFSGSYPTFTPPPLPSSLSTPFQLPSAEQFQANDPGFAARFALGQKAIQRSAAAQGTVLNPGTLQALTSAGQDLASSEYGNYVKQLLDTRQQNASDYLNLTYGPSWQTNQAAVNQYGQLYKQYSDAITNNRNAYNDYINALLEQERIGVGAAGAGGSSPTSVGA